MRLPHLGRRASIRDISSLIDSKTNPNNNDGESHKSPSVLDGSQLISLPVGDGGEKVAVYWSANPNNAKVENAYIMIHGRKRDGDHYWSVMRDALKSAQDANYTNAKKDVLIIAPQMYSTKLNKGQYDPMTLAWADVNAWQSGATATHPKKTDANSMDALDAILDHLSNTTAFPSLKNITMVGHGGGAQLMNRYAATGKDPQNNQLYVRYIVGDPSSSPYFTRHRPVTDKSIAMIDECDGYDEWRYGFSNFTGTRNATLQPKDYFGRYLRRDVVNIVGLEDIKLNGDQKCMALLQGGPKRRNRNLSWWRYINMLAKTDEDLTGFPGNFSELPDWSDVYSEKIGTRLAIVANVTHDVDKLFNSKIGRSALFDDYNIERGWRPSKNWKSD